MDDQVFSFNENWKFLRTDLAEGLADAEKKMNLFQPVEIPHDWLIYDAENLYRDGCGWYYKEFEARKGERLILRFDGVYMDSTVYVNHRKLCDWKYGYSTFDVDLAGALVDGTNRIMVQVRFQAPNSRWYSGAGIYRDVWVKKCGEAYLAFDGTYVHAKKADGGFLLDVETEAAGAFRDGLQVRYSLADADGGGKELGCSEVVFTGSMEGDGTEDSEDVPFSGLASLSVLVENPEIWDLDHPYCYRLVVELSEQGRVLDRQFVTIGFREFEFTTDRGFFLNGRHVKIHGVCEHHDFGCLGAAFHSAAMERKIKMLKEMGCNALRLSHNMPAPQVMELADRMGMLILDEAFDMWERTKTPYDYGRFFKEWHRKDVRSFVRRDRNHPSLLMWSIGNEIYDTHADEHGQEITRELVECVRKYDRKENAPITIGSNYMPWENARKCADIVKFAGYNYGEKYYGEHHGEHPDWVMYGSETASFVESRGIYRFPVEQSMLSDEDEQCSCLGNSTTSWGARSWNKCITIDRDADYILGQFLWTGFDYIGEPTPYHTKNSYFGRLDTAGFCKDSYYLFQAEWTDVNTNPMVHLFPYWDFNPGQQINVRACTNAGKVELFLNGMSLGVRTIDHKNGENLLADWTVSYEPGTITAVAYDKDGKETARDSHVSFGGSKKIVLKADKGVLAAGGEDLCFVTVETVDENGNPVENAVDYVKAQIEGPGRILGMDNGDSTDYDQYKTNVRKLFSGKLLIVMGSMTEEGEIVLKVSGRGLEDGILMLHAKKLKENAERRRLENFRGKKTFLENCAEKQSGFPDRIPIRKLEIRAPEGRKFSAERKTLPVSARLCPADTTDCELEWRIVNAAGIDVNLAKIETGLDLSVIRVTALSDGEFYVRCMAKSEGHTRIISQLEFQAEGIGTAFLNPYEFISAGLFSDTIGEISNGNEKGIATARDGESGAVYENIDFGDFGSDEITLPVFALSDDDYVIDMWLGEPGKEGGRLLKSLHYQKPSIWNTYQEETYKLPERIKGVATIGFVMHAKVHLKGFWFKKLDKAYEKLDGADSVRVYGDSFTREGAKVTGIGNNVTIEYDNMDFGEEGASSVAVCGYTPLEVNTIHIHFTDEDGNMTNRILEFRGGAEESCREQVFEIEKLKGSGKLELIFLPGSNFDFASIRFSRQQE